ncbi:MAG TPA: ABC transporter permease subunit [Candidatus Limnocylindrales bacterium]|nr:ABC transporter permease subunit [Candidatus Limnocylindrales bacterium]
MSNLLRADLLRFRRRRDFWVILIGIAILTAVTFLGAYRSESEDFPPFNQAEFEQMLDESGMFEGLTPAEAAQQRAQMIADQRAQEERDAADREAQQQLELRRYAFPQSLLTMLGSAILPFLALVLVASMAVGDEFRFGTLRTSLIAASDRRRFLAARMISLTAIAAGLIAAILLLGAILPLILGLAGVALPATPGLDPLGTILLLGVDLLIVVALMAFATMVSLIMRTGTLSVVLLLVYGLIELYVANLPIFAIGNFLAAVPQFFFVQSIRAIQLRLTTDAGALATGGESFPPMAIDLGVPLMVAIVAAWTLLFLLIADRRIRTMDVTE